MEVSNLRVLPTAFLLAVLSLVGLIGGMATWAAEESPRNADAAKTQAEGLEVFKKHVRLVLAHNCVSCHGGDAKESDLDLTTREGLLKGGYSGPAVVPGKAESSLLVKLITHAEEPRMPEEADKLADAEIAAITKWINLGAPYDRPLIDAESATPWTERTVDPAAREFWSFQPLQRPDLPKVKDESWCRTPIDQFVLARLEAAGLAPNPPATRRELIRRAYFDLIGMPPTPAEVEAFLNDTSADAWPRLIDRLLARSEYGERWARHWLDLARFAESHGFEQDYDRPHAYHYRDFVIQALNEDMPYDQFVRWQLAGDEYAPDKTLAMMATGFLGAGVFPTQITKNEVERTRYDALDDMAATTGVAMLGLTVGCARCHDHKFDPIPQADYYRMVSVFTTTVRSNVKLTKDHKAYELARKEFDKRHAPLVDALARYEREKLPQTFAAWEAANGKTEQQNAWQILDVTEWESSGGAEFAKQEDGSLLVTGPNQKYDTYVLTAQTAAQHITAIRLETLADKSMKRGGPGRAGNGNFALTNFRVTARPLNGEGEPVEVEFTRAKATYDRAGYESALAIDDNPRSCWALDPHFGRNHAAVFETKQDIGFPGGTVLQFELQFNGNTQHNIGRPRLSITQTARPVQLESGPPAAIARLLGQPAAERDAKGRQQLLEWFKKSDPQWQQLNRQVAESQARAPKPQTMTVMVASEGVKPIRHHTQGADFFEKTYFLRRGDVAHKQGEAPPGYLQVLMRNGHGPSTWQQHPPEGATTSYRRRALAEWIMDTQNGAGHLATRVIVNRLWQHHLGRGIVATPNDFGAQGARPTHPELLDWLASELIARGYRLKEMHRLIMNSAVYRQSSQFEAAKSQADIENSLWWRQSYRRLEAEAIRDSMLSVSGTLDRRMFGPGSLNESHNRRSIYFTIKRSKLIPVLQLFDAPEPLASMGRRPSTTVAPQALLFMNNDHVRRYAGNFAAQLEKVRDTPLAEIIEQGYLHALSRPPSAEELQANVAFVETQTSTYQKAGKPQPRRLALTDFCQVLLSSNEFIYVP